MVTSETSSADVAAVEVTGPEFPILPGAVRVVGGGEYCSGHWCIGC